MENNKIYSMSFNKVYSLLIAKAERKGKNKEDVYELTAWLLGYRKDKIESMYNSDISYGDFFLNAINFNPKAENIKGSICGVKIEEIEDPLMKKIRYLDKLVDELAKGKTVEKILDKYK